MLHEVELSILIVNWNTQKLLRECLDSVYAKWSTIDLEVIVVDNNSSDQSAEMVETEFPQVVLVRNDTNLGFVQANNQAAVLAKGRFILLLNSDTKVIDPDVKSVLDYLDAHQDVGIVTGKVLNSDGSFQRPFRCAPHPFGALLRHTTRLVVGFNTPFHRRYRMENVGDSDAIEVDWVTGAYVFLRRELVNDGEVFDPDLFMYYEDTLLCFRCWQKGYRVMYLPLAPIIHYGGGSAKQVRAFTAFNSFKSSVTYFEKTRGRITANVYGSAVKMLWRTFAGMFRVLSVFSGRRFVKKAELFSELTMLDKENQRA